MPESTDRLQREVAAAFIDVLAPQPGDDARLAAMIAVAMKSPPGGPPPATGGPAAKLWPKLVVAGGLGLVVAALLTTPGAPTLDTLPAAVDVEAAVVPLAVRPEPIVVVVAAQVLDVAEAPDTSAGRAPPRPARPRASATPSATPVVNDDPDALLRAANQARRTRSFAEADRLYTDLQARFPGSRAARTSHVPHARLLLDTLGRPADALDAFSAYLAADPRGTLSEEALVGRAQALRELGRLADAREGWRSLLERFPESVHAPTARRQIAGARP